MENPVDKLSLPELIVKIADDRKASNILQMNVRGISSIADDVIILSGTSAPHLRALADRIGRDVREILDVRPRVVDGSPNSGWILMDYPDVTVHILTPEIRDRYDLEKLWADAPRVDTLAKLQHFREKAKRDAEALIAAAAARTSVVPKPAAKKTTVKKTAVKAPAKKASAKSAEKAPKKTVKKAESAVKKAPAKKTAAAKPAVAKTVRKVKKADA